MSIDMTIKCPYCGTHDINYFSERICEKVSLELSKDHFIILKFMEFDNRIKRLENNGKKEMESSREGSNDEKDD